MKLKNIFLALLATAFVFVGCQKETPVTLDNIQLSETYLSIPEAGGTVSVTINATEDWAFVTDDVWPEVITRDSKTKEITKTVASWLSADKMSGTAGETMVTFSAAKTTGGHEQELQIKVGNNTQFLRVRQGSLEAVSATCKDVIDGPDGKTYKVKGVVTSIVNTEYGNWYLTDSTGEVYIYGTLDKNGATKNFKSLGLEVGDVVTVQGPKTTYGSTIELVDVTVINITKSLLKVLDDEKVFTKEGGEETITLAYKGKGVYYTIPEEFRSWVSVSEIKQVLGVPNKIEQNPADTAFVTLSIAENVGGGRVGSISFSSTQDAKTSSNVTYNFEQEGSIVECNVSEFLARPVDAKALYKISGKVKSIVNASYGNFYLEDNTGVIYVYGLTATPQAKNDKSFGSLGIKEGDQVTLIGVRAQYSNSKVEDQKEQVGSAYYVSSSTDISVADFLAAPVSNKVWYRLTGSVKEIKSDKYGNLYIEDATGYVYIYGLTSTYAFDYKTKKHVNDQKFAELGLVAGDKISICCQRGQYANAKVADQKEEGLMGYFIGKIAE